MKRYRDETLRELRNNVPVRWVIERLLQLPAKEVEGVYKFTCPSCSEFSCSINPQANLGRCHRCEKNFNPIDLVMAETKQSFINSVRLLLDKQADLNTTSATSTKLPLEVKTLLKPLA